MKKVIAIEYGQIHYHAGCYECDFTSAISTEKNSNDVRAEVRKHVRKTGHECWVEAGTHTSYKLEGGRTPLAPDKWESAPSTGIVPPLSLSTPQSESTPPTCG